MFKDKKTRSIVSVVLAILLVITLWAVISSSNKVDVISYGEFKQLVRENKVQYAYAEGTTIRIKLIDDSKISDDDFLKNGKADKVSTLGSITDFSEFCEQYRNGELKDSAGNPITAVANFDYDWKPAQESLLELLLPYIPLVITLIIGYILVKKVIGANNKGMSFGKTKARATEISKVKFSDVAGAKEEKYELQEVVDFLSNSKKYTDLGAKIPKGVLLVGPPGTGKTSIARSVARALNKEYVRISLGGVHDEAEIRGHRRTYVGAMPGRIIDALKTAGVNNPLMLLDEVDKASSDYKGDTSAALLEVLDQAQNDKFRDHYVELPVDLSNVLFIATANDISTISKPLRDRMEIIEVSSYTENEKFHIAKDYLVSRQIEKNGLSKDNLTISENALHTIIHSYTREAGVRNLERKISAICRKSAREIVENKKTRVRITERNLNKYLGRERYDYIKANNEDEIGIVRGLAWTAVGGDTLQIEVNVMPGKGAINLTGQMGDVMKESAQIALTYVRSISEQYDIAEDYFEKRDIHLHIPEGAVPKDGPSAGITMATAILSAVTGRKVKASVAMTGEITLRGRVLPIGGLKEKLLAANMAGIKTVVVPEKNRKDVEELSEEITNGMKIVYASTMKDVLSTALC